jgi:hypothetical protein
MGPQGTLMVVQADRPFSEEAVCVRTCKLLNLEAGIGKSSIVLTPQMYRCSLVSFLQSPCSSTSRLSLLTSLEYKARLAVAVCLSATRSVMI